MVTAVVGIDASSAFAQDQVNDDESESEPTASAEPDRSTRLGQPVAGRTVESVAPGAPVNVPPVPGEPRDPLGEGFFGRLRVGARLGFGFANVATKPEGETAGRVGLNVCGFATLRLYPTFEAEVGFGYSQRGFNIRPPVPGQSDTEVEFDYFEVPLLLRGRIPWGRSKATIRVAAGVNLLILDTARSKNDSNMIDIDGNVNRFDAGLALGGGLDFQFGQWLAFVDFRHDHSLVDAVDVPDLDLAAFQRVSTIQLGLAF